MKLSLSGTIGLGLSKFNFGYKEEQKIKIGIIGLDTSHSIKFTKVINNAHDSEKFKNYVVVAAYPKGSLDIKSSTSRIPEYTRKIKKMGVEIVPSEDELLDKVDVVLLETNDGRRHLEQALKIFRAKKPVFIDKPMAASLKDVIAIFDAAKKYRVPVFSSSSLRYMEHAQKLRHGQMGKVFGAETYSAAPIEKTHPDLFWYGIHGVEALFTVMGTGCKKVVRVHTKNTDVVVGTWADGRIGTFRGTRLGRYDSGGTAFTNEGEKEIGPYKGYKPLLKHIIAFFRTGTAPVNPQETIEIYAFMKAADLSKKNGGKPILLNKVLPKK